MEAGLFMNYIICQLALDLGGLKEPLMNTRKKRRKQIDKNYQDARLSPSIFFLKLFIILERTFPWLKKKKLL